MLLVCILVPIFVTGKNVNQDTKAIARLSDPQMRQQIAMEQAVEKAREEERARLEAQLEQEREHAQMLERQNAELASRAETEPVIIENAGSDSRQSSARDEAARRAAEQEQKRQRELVAQQEKKRAEEAARRKAEDDRRRAEKQKELELAKQNEARRKKAEDDRKKAEQLAASRAGNGKLTVINETTHKKVEVITPDQAAQRRQQQAQTQVKVVQPASRPGEKYAVSAGVYSSITAAKNVQTKISGSCSSHILPISRDGKRLFKVQCTPTPDMNRARSIQTALGRMSIAANIEKAN